jgi:hypothetical protein
MVATAKHGRVIERSDGWCDTDFMLISEFVSPGTITIGGSGLVGLPGGYGGAFFGQVKYEENSTVPYPSGAA